MNIFPNTFPSQYRKVTPYTEIIHTVGLLHSSRQRDAEFAFSLLENAFKQKRSDFFILITYETTVNKKSTFLYKMYRKGKSDFLTNKGKMLKWLKTEYNSEKKFTSCHTKLSKSSLVQDKKRFDVVINKLLESACITGYKYILYYDIGKEDYEMWMRISPKT